MKAALVFPACRQAGALGNPKALSRAGSILSEAMGKRHKANVLLSGFTLIEVLIAIFILGMGIVTLANLFPLGLQSLSYARKLNEVYFLAERKLEEIKLQPNITPGESSGVENDLNWKASIQPLSLDEGIEVTFIELEVSFFFQGRLQKQRIITYLNT